MILVELRADEGERGWGMPVIGDSVLYKGTTGRIHPAILTAIDGSNVAQLYVWPDDFTVPWELGFIAQDFLYTGIAMGTGNDQWQPSASGTDVATSVIGSIVPGMISSTITATVPGLISAAVASALASLNALKAPTVSVVSRTLGTAFKPSATRPVLCLYSGRVASSLSLAGGSGGRLELVSDSAATPTTIRARVAGGSTGTLAVGLGVNDVAEGLLMYMAPANDNVLLRGVNETGTPTFTLTTQIEIML